MFTQHDCLIWLPCLFWNGLRKLVRKTGLAQGLSPKQVVLYGYIFSLSPPSPTLLNNCTALC